MTTSKLSFLLLILTLFTGCDFIKDSFTYKDKTKNFVEALMKKDYDNCISQMALQSPMGKNTNIDTLKVGLDNFRTLVGSNFGDGKFEYSLMKAEKKTLDCCKRKYAS